MDFTVPEFDIERNRDRCTLCGACVKECSYKVHFFSKDKKAVLADERKCVACHRCAVICPSHAIKIVKYDMAYRDHANWTPTAQKEIIKQATTGGVLLSGMSNNKPYPIYWDKMLLNASQETNCQGLFNQIHKKGARSTVWLLTPRLTDYIFPFSRSLQRYA